MIGKVLVIDDEASCRLAQTVFAAEGFEVLTAHDGPSGLRKAAVDRPDVVLLELRLPGLDGLAVLEQFTISMPSVPVVMLTASRDVKNAVRAIQLGASGYFTKPINDEAIAAVRRALEAGDLRLDVRDLRHQVIQGTGEGLALKMGSSDQVKQVIEQVAIVAASDFTVLVLGETGTGKELVAQAIHQLSGRRRGPFVALDCGAIPESLVESELFGYEKGAFTGAERRKDGRLRFAESGTCFLDELGNLPMNLQAKLLRVLESGQVQPVGADQASAMNVRFVGATNDDLQGRITQGLFRLDLYFRLAQYSIRLPPLRERPDDIAHLTERFVEEVSIELRRPIQAVAPDALALLRRHSWPGNVRELRNVVRQAVLQTKGLVIRSEAVQLVLGETDSAAAVPAARTGGQSLREIAVRAAAAAEREAICETLRATHGNKSQAAKALSTDYKTLHVKMKHLGIRARDFVP